MKNKYVLIGIFLILISITMLVYLEYANKKNDLKRVNIHDITNSGAKSENVNVYLNASYIAGVLATKKGDIKNSFYVVFGDGVQYIVYLNNDMAKKVNDYLLDNPYATYKIVGTTKLLPSGIEEYGIKFVKEWLDTNHDHSETVNYHSHNITKEEFYEYFGYVYVDGTKSKYTLFAILNIIMYSIGGIGLVLILKNVYQKYVK